MKKNGKLLNENSGQEIEFRGKGTGIFIEKKGNRPAQVARHGKSGNSGISGKPGKSSPENRPFLRGL